MASQTPNVFTYPRSEPGTTGHLDLVEPLRALPKQLDDMLKHVTDAQASVRPGEDAWCLKEIVGHLRDACEVYHKRLYMMSTQTDPVLEPYDPDAFARDHNYVDRGIGEMLRELREFRATTVHLLTTLVNWNWARTGQHLESGRMSIRQLVEHMIEHEAEHLADARRLAAAVEGL
jgi:DinB family protein